MKYPRLLSSGSNNGVIVLNETEVAKLFVGDSRSDIDSEAEKMRFANQVNSLVVQFKRLEFNEELQAEMLVMERVYPLDFRAYEIEKRKLWLNVFIDEIDQLHKSGFIHGHIKRVPNLTGQTFDNILLTDSGLRLIDVGISAIREKVEGSVFAKYLKIETVEIREFMEYFLSR